MQAIVLDELSRRFGDEAAVDALSLNISEGELFGLVGPDGSGKTTTLRMLAGILRPTSGDAIVGGASIRRDPEGVKHRIAYMSQRFGLYTDLTVRENIDFYADLYGVPRRVRPARIERLYAFSNLGPFERRLAGQLSGGMKQKLSLCCALIHRPNVMLLDEPTFGVDPISRRDLWLIIHQMVADGTTVLVSTAYMDEAERCDRIAMLSAGRLLALDSPQKIQERVPEIVSIRTAEPRRARDLLRNFSAVESADLFGESVHVSLQEGTDWTLVEQTLVSSGVTIIDSETGRASLEDVFIRLVRSSEGA